MLYQLDLEKQDYTKVRRVSLQEIGWKEADLERLVSKNILCSSSLPYLWQNGYVVYASRSVY